MPARKPRVALLLYSCLPQDSPFPPKLCLQVLLTSWCLRASGGAGLLLTHRFPAKPGISESGCLLVEADVGLKASLQSLSTAGKSQRSCQDALRAGDLSTWEQAPVEAQLGAGQISTSRGSGVPLPELLRAPSPSSGIRLSQVWKRSCLLHCLKAQLKIKTRKKTTQHKSHKGWKGIDLDRVSLHWSPAGSRGRGRPRVGKARGTEQQPSWPAQSLPSRGLNTRAI